MKLEDVIAGQYYAAHYPGGENPTIIKATHDKSFKQASGIYYRELQDNYNYLSSNAFSCTDKLRLATEKEIHWLDLSIKNNYIVDYEVAMESFAKEKPITYSNEPDPELAEILKKLLNLN
jgi:hypothetical protein